MKKWETRLLALDQAHSAEITNSQEVVSGMMSTSIIRLQKTTLFQHPEHTPARLAAFINRGLSLNDHDLPVSFYTYFSLPALVGGVKYTIILSTQYPTP